MVTNSPLNHRISLTQSIICRHESHVCVIFSLTQLKTWAVHTYIAIECFRRIFGICPIFDVQSKKKNLYEIMLRNSTILYIYFRSIFCLCHVSFKSRIDCSVFLWLCVALFNSWIEQCCTKNESVGERSTEKNWKFWINTYAIVDRKECRPSKKGQRNVKEISKWFDIHIGGIFESKGIGVRSVQ